jgi:hypothetical protein
MTQINITKRQSILLGIALTMMYDEIAKTNEGKSMKQEVMELAKLIQSNSNK